MRSYKIVLVSLFVFFSVALNAQLFVAGSFNVNYSGGKIQDGTTKIDQPTKFEFSLYPKVGKFLSEKAAIGLQLGFSTSTENDKAAVATITKSNAVAVTPFVRYYAFTFDKFSAFAQANLGFGFSKSSDKNGGVTTTGPAVTGISFSVFPALAYNLSDRFSLETSLNVLSFGFSQHKTKEGSVTTTDSGFNFGGGLNDVARPGNITIGAILKF
jgi:outer membrane protein